MKSENEIGAIVVNCAVRLHKEIGQGLFGAVKAGFDIFEFGRMQAWISIKFWRSLYERRNFKDSERQIIIYFFVALWLCVRTMFLIFLYV